MSGANCYQCFVGNLHPNNYPQISLSETVVCKGGDHLGATHTRGFAISARGRVVGVVCLLSWSCVNKNLCREEIYAATTQGKKSHFRIYRE